MRDREEKKLKQYCLFWLVMKGVWKRRYGMGRKRETKKITITNSKKGRL